MKAAQLKERPGFPLMKQTDEKKRNYMQMPRWLFSDPRYIEMSLETKVVYTFLLNRFQLSRRMGWVNEEGEVFVIFPRRAMAEELRICEKRVTLAFRKLTELRLIWEQRCGRGDANQIYLAQVEPAEEPAEVSEVEAAEETRTAEETVLTEAKVQEPLNCPFQNRGFFASKTADPTVQEPPGPPSILKEREKRNTQKEVSQSVRAAPRDRTPDEEELTGILNNCELQLFSAETARVFENAIERLYYTESFRVGNATLPQSRVRAKLRYLNASILQEAEEKLSSNRDRKIQNSTAYTMATILNCITECESDLMVDPYLNDLRASLKWMGGNLCPT